jgi:hypothetical protein
MAVEAPVKTEPAKPAVTAAEMLSAASSPPSQSDVHTAGQIPRPSSHHVHAHWEEFARFSNYWEGHVLAGLLRNEDVPAKLIFLWPSFDAGFSLVLVPRELLHRARWVLSWPAPSEAELTFLATGELLSGQEGSSESTEQPGR